MQMFLYRLARTREKKKLEFSDKNANKALGELTHAHIQKKVNVSIKHKGEVIEIPFNESISAFDMTPKSKFYLIGSFKKFGIWNSEQKEFDKMFDDAHTDWIQAIKITEDAKHAFTMSKEMIVVWDLSLWKEIYRYSHSGSDLSALELSADYRHIITAATDELINIWSTELMPQNPELVKSPLKAYSSLSTLYNSASSYSEKGQACKVLVDTLLYSKNWNYLFYLVFLSPEFHPEMLERAIEQEVRIILDRNGNTQLDYLLNNPDRLLAAQRRFQGKLFEGFANLVDYDAKNRDEVIASNATHLANVFENQNATSCLNYLASFAFDLEDHPGIMKLPEAQGSFKKGSKAFIHLSDFEKSFKKRIVSDGKIPLEYSMVGIPMTWKIYSEEVMKFMNNLSGSQNSKLHELPMVQHIVDYFWLQAQWYYLIIGIIYLFPFGLFSGFVGRRNEKDNDNVLIPLIVFNGILAAIEFVQLSANYSDYLRDVWNYVDILFLAFQGTVIGLHYADFDPEWQTMIISGATFLSYTKLLVMARAFNSLRYLIRMIVETLKDMVSFLIVCGVYLFGFALARYQSRKQIPGQEVTFRDFGSDMFIVYNMFYGDWDSDEYPDSLIPFFMIVSFLLTLVLLNMVIAIMGDTYDRVKDNLVVVDTRERLSMIQEAAIMMKQCKRLLSFICCGCLCAMSSQRGFLLVALPYNPQDTEGTNTNEWSGRIKEMKKELHTSLGNIRDEMKKLRNEFRRNNEYSGGSHSNLFLFIFSLTRVL